jgi:hypothetical protein
MARLFTAETHAPLGLSIFTTLRLFDTSRLTLVHEVRATKWPPRAAFRRPLHIRITAPNSRILGLGMSVARTYPACDKTDPSS